PTNNPFRRYPVVGSLLSGCLFLGCLLLGAAPLGCAHAPRAEAGTSDRDGDGIKDSDDPCPNEPEDEDGFADKDGCPDNDNDGDGIPDAHDLCPNLPEDKDGFEDEDGCPEKDNDGDNIPDAQDQCPNEPETYNAVKDADGCPDRAGAPRLVHVCPITIMDAVNFAKGSARLAAKTSALLDAIARALKENVQIGTLEVRGYASAHEAHGEQLAKRRAESVRVALLARGVNTLLVPLVGPAGSLEQDSGKACQARRCVTFHIPPPKPNK
ncbi:MAG: OmpA family protein, partial [Deltaproteobacteria bacterium]|nr:OmpA family protein [Deltaproteobacteria bacterium]